MAAYTIANANLTKDDRLKITTTTTTTTVHNRLWNIGHGTARPHRYNHHSDFIIIIIIIIIIYLLHNFEHIRITTMK